MLLPRGRTGEIAYRGRDVAPPRRRPVEKCGRCRTGMMEVGNQQGLTTRVRGNQSVYFPINPSNLRSRPGTFRGPAGSWYGAANMPMRHSRSFGDVDCQTSAVSANSGVRGEIGEEQLVGGGLCCRAYRWQPNTVSRRQTAFGRWRKRGVTPSSAMGAAISRPGFQGLLYSAAAGSRHHGCRSTPSCA
jgi:hypothetical protein